ncbi:PREDICTED: exostosin-2-like [Amphimedon queenslandica]|uniref:Exostosin GT47 domain-containing protein n=1 Tax=Amphimedon queenslandica TaxID=400682 RepID=A0A1X7VN92_AMPQE|nr:PREDICTED: exostosin-2-like [Amphimedon queenslandica]|eukprot:XP_019860562.1 PREDICTED: exostosin-2-like [Amphimedon queenslandica]
MDYLLKRNISCTRSTKLIIIFLSSFLFLIFIWHWMGSGFISRPDNDDLPISRSDSIYELDSIKDLSFLKWKSECLFFTCFEINSCRYGKENEEMIRVYVYPFSETLASMPHLQTYPSLLDHSDEYIQILETIRSSRYYEPLPEEACVFVPPFDTLNGRLINNRLTSYLLNNLKLWNNGSNHLIFSMLPWQKSHPNTTVPVYNYGKVLLMGGAFTVSNYRPGYDISIPVFNPLTIKYDYHQYHNIKSRQLLLVILVQSGADPHTVNHIRISLHQELIKGGVVMLGSCDLCSHCINERCDFHANKKLPYPDILQDSKYCMIVSDGTGRGTPDLMDVLMMGCVPVIIRNYELVLPFSEVIDWQRFAVFVWLEQLFQLMPILGSSRNGLILKQKQVLHVYSRYFRSIPAITMTTLDILNDRVFPINAQSYEDWNGHDDNQIWNVKHSHIKLPSTKKEEGFTAVILAYDRIDKLFQTVQSVAQAPSLAKFVIVWNHAYKSPPPLSDWPFVNKPIKIIRTKNNKLSNRFYPYSDITTAGILSLDDDINMMSSDEIEFGFQTWLEYPDRLVGYPGRVHRYNHKSANWVYDSEWTNNVSIVLTGAAFYHKYYHYHYTYLMPKAIRTWVDVHFNCEDIMFNFMISNITGLPPLKVTPRKRFKCKNCNTEGLVGDSAHYIKRTECINLFAKQFGDTFPLKSIKYRLDPVLYKVESKREKAFPKVGEL